MSAQLFSNIKMFYLNENSRFYMRVVYHTFLRLVPSAAILACCFFWWGSVEHYSGQYENNWEISQFKGMDKAFNIILGNDFTIWNTDGFKG